jgi:ubiquinone/menaquinone biosynthesis C-methylase UbiE
MVGQPGRRAACGWLGAVTDNDPVTGRRMLTRSAYADDRHLRARQAIWAYAERPADWRWRTSAVPWDGTQVVADVGCGNGLDLRQLVPQGRCRYAFGLDLSAGMLRSLEDLRPSARLSLIQADAQSLPLRDAAVDVALAMHMLYHVPDLQAAARELRRVVKPGGTLLASTNSADTLTELYDLLNAAISELLGRPVETQPALSFSTETGRAILEREFSEVALRRHDLTLSLPEAQPVTAYLGTVCEPLLSHIGEPFDFDAALDEVAARVQRVIQAEGRFRATGRTGLFVCR